PARGPRLPAQRRGPLLRTEHRSAPLYELQGLRGVDKRYGPNRPGQRLPDHLGLTANLFQGQQEPLESGAAMGRGGAAAFLELRDRLVRTHMDSENRMLVRRSLIPLVLALFAARCSDGPHPTAVQPLTPAPHFLQWAGGSAPQFTVTGALSGGGTVKGVALASMTGGLSLNQYSASFWGVRGEPRSIQINSIWPPWHPST